MVTFSDYMNGLSTEKVSEKKQMINRIAEACCVNDVAVYNWIAGRAKPSALARKAISGVLNLPESELFPEFAGNQQY